MEARLIYYQPSPCNTPHRSERFRAVGPVSISRTNKLSSMIDIVTSRRIRLGRPSVFTGRRQTALDACQCLRGYRRQGVNEVYGYYAGSSNRQEIMATVGWNSERRRFNEEQQIMTSRSSICIVILAFLSKLRLFRSRLVGGHDRLQHQQQFLIYCHNPTRSAHHNTGYKAFTDSLFNELIVRISFCLRDI
jgi:hypothetical protein